MLWEAMAATHRFNYVVTAQKPTAVRHSAVGCFTAPGVLNLIVSYVVVCVGAP